MLIPTWTLPLLITIVCVVSTCWPGKVTDLTSQIAYDMRWIFRAVGAIISALVWAVWGLFQ